MGFHKRLVWDPKLILAQMAAMQFFFYTTFGFLLGIIDTLAGQPISLGQIFDYRSITFSNVLGWTSIFTFILNGFAGGVSLVYVVERHRKCLDFAATVHIFHFFISCFYGGFPYRWQWWAINVVSLLFMSLLGEYLCMRKELQDIPLASKDRSSLVSTV
ncbi:hypothetical protein PROFUN_04142 [Planoprotostelium fungivorum]|uniref:Protein SYS1 homolog n=1 Tax=Planoprotostelium fungivorum TaxID=1890364 RepID=A0A2P6NJM3_9EUKA|nr:hypothetical protein PROFUN_04142 [Planoprotostelium fungivorum]